MAREPPQLNDKDFASAKRQTDSVLRQIRQASDGPVDLAGSVLTCGMVLFIIDSHGQWASTEDIILLLQRFLECGLSATVTPRAFEKSINTRRFKMVNSPEHRWVYGKNPQSPNTRQKPSKDAAAGPKRKVTDRDESAP